MLIKTGYPNLRHGYDFGPGQAKAVWASLARIHRLYLSFSSFVIRTRVIIFRFRFLSLRNDITVLLSREDIFSSRENLSLHEEELDVNRLDYYQVSRDKQSQVTREN